MKRLSRESEQFLTDLNAYLMTKGLDEKEVKQFIDEAELHLWEGEADGKTVEDIFGKTPKQYAEEVAQEMTFAKKQNVKYVLAVLIGASAYLLLSRALKGPVSFSWIEMIGFPAAYLLMFFITLLAIRRSSFLARWKEFGVLYLSSLLGIAIFIGILFADRLLGNPVIEFETTGTVIIGIVASLIFIAEAIYFQSWLVILIPLAWFGPEALINILNVTSAKYMLMQTFVSLTLVGLIAYFSLQRTQNAHK